MEKQYHLFDNITEANLYNLPNSFIDLQSIITDFNSDALNSICTIFVRTTEAAINTSEVIIDINNLIGSTPKFNFLGLSKFINTLPNIKIQDLYQDQESIKLNFNNLKLPSIRSINNLSSPIVEDSNDNTIYPSVYINTVNCCYKDDNTIIEVYSNSYIPNLFINSISSLLPKIDINQDLINSCQNVFIEDTTGGYSFLKGFSSNNNFNYIFRNIDFQEQYNIDIIKKDNLNAPFLHIINCKGYILELNSNSTSFDSNKENSIGIFGGNGWCNINNIANPSFLIERAHLELNWSLPNTGVDLQRVVFYAYNSHFAQLSLNVNNLLSISSFAIENCYLNGSIKYSSIASDSIRTDLQLNGCRGKLSMPLNSNKQISPEFSVIDTLFPVIESISRPLEKTIYEVDFMETTITGQINKFLTQGTVTLPVLLTDFSDQEIRLRTALNFNSMSSLYTKKGFRINKRIQLHKKTTIYNDGINTIIDNVGVGIPTGISALLAFGIGINPTGNSSVNVNGVFDTFIGFRFQKHKTNNNFAIWHSRKGFFKPSSLNGKNTGIPFPSVGEAYDLYVHYIQNDNGIGTAYYKIVDKRKGILYEDQIDTSGMTSPSGDDLYFGIDKVINWHSSYNAQIQLLDSKFIKYEI